MNILLGGVQSEEPIESPRPAWLLADTEQL